MTDHRNKEFIRRHIGPSVEEQKKMLSYLGFNSLDEFIKKKSSLGKSIAGWGVGGRGVITLATIKNSNLISYILDNSKITSIPLDLYNDPK